MSCSTEESGKAQRVISQINPPNMFRERSEYRLNVANMDSSVEWLHLV